MPVARASARDLAARLTALRGYRQTRWRAVILYGLAGSGKTVLAQALADDAEVRRAFRDGVAWVDGSREPEAEVKRLCLGCGLAREPGERWVECWRRWAGADARRLLLIIDDALDTEALPLFIAGLGPQVVTLITTQQGVAIRAEVERWLPADALLAVGVPGLTPAEGRVLAEVVVGRPLAAPEWTLVQEIGELIGWHPAALRLAAIEGRELGWAGPLAELQAGRLPWATVRQAVLRQWDRLPAEQRGWVKTLNAGATANAAFSTDEAAQWWQVAPAVARRRLWLLQGGGLVIEADSGTSDAPRWRVAPIAHRVLTEGMAP